MKDRDITPDALPCEGVLAEGRKVVVVVGIDRYRAWPTLNNAVSDAKGALRVFLRLGFEQAMEPLIDEAATADAIRRLATDELASLGSDDSLVLFVAGHGHTRTRTLQGGPVQTGYIIPVDGDHPEGHTATWLRLDSWLSDVARLPARHILVILDACHSGIALGSLIKWRGGGDAWRGDSLDDLRRRQSRRVITSALADQRAMDGGPINGHSLFTGCLIEGLTGGLARDGRREATGTEIGLYVQQRVTSYPGSNQTPDFGTLELDNRGELVVPIVTNWQPPQPISAPPNDRRATHEGGTGVTVRRDGRDPQRRSTVKSTEGEPTFTGRDDELRAIEDVFRDRRVAVLYGAPGLGKTRLAKEYAHEHVEAYPGGMFFVPFDQPPPTELARLLRDTGKPAYSDESVEDQCRRALRDLGSAGRTLLIYDAVADERTLREWLPYEGLDWHLIVTSTSAKWASSWSTVEIGALHEQAARALVAVILSDEAAADRLAEPITAKAAGITIELCACATAAHERLRRGRTVAGFAAELARETASSFEAAWALLSQSAQFMLRVACAFATARIPAPLIVSTLERIGWCASAVEDAIDEACDRRLAAGDGESVDVHQLVAQFVRGREPLVEREIRQSLLQELITTAKGFSEHPADPDLRALMLAHSLKLDVWADVITDGSQWHVVGDAAIELGRFEAARLWFERAVAAKEQGDVYGCVDTASLGTSRHQVGQCYLSVGKFEEARTWFERAVAVKEQGDVHGRVDAASLGTSLHQVGYCYSSMGKFEEARVWFERAVAAKDKGDVHGRVDSASLGTSLHHVGYCYAGVGKFEEARSWFERAVAAKDKGDVHGRVDPASLGTSLHHVGDCYSDVGMFEEARLWFERAVAAKERGDVHGRVDSASLGTSLDQVGDCYGRLGNFEEARAWLEGAVAAKEKGDVHGRVDSASLGRSLDQVGYCYSRIGEFKEARAWFERAVAAKGKGDVHGRVDPASLGTSLHRLGYCCLRVGEFEEARAWFERAVNETEKGDVHGRVDSASLGRSLHEVGDCYSRVDKFEEARAWFERAVTAKEKGDVYGRVDPASLGRSLHHVGGCYSSMGKFEEARVWFERAVVAKEKGDVHGRVNPASLGASFHQVGYCYSSMGKFEDARAWFERAVTAAEEGDVHGRVDPESLGASLDQVGHCYLSVGEFEEARVWFERAVAAVEKGDVYGRVKPANLGALFDQIGDCYSRMGRFEEALPWFERAVTAAENGDVHGYVDLESLRMSLDQVGECYSSMGRLEEARLWFERASKTMQCGDP